MKNQSIHTIQIGSIKKQQGAVLIVGIVMVLILSILVIAGVNSTVLQQKMTSNLRDKELAFQSAETTLKIGEDYLLTSTETELANIFDGTNGLYTFNKNRALKEESDWENISARESETLFQIKEKPEHIIEELPHIEVAGDSLASPKIITGAYYRVTSKSKGGTDASLVVLQSMYKK